MFQFLLKVDVITNQINDKTFIYLKDKRFIYLKVDVITNHDKQIDSNGI